MRHSGSLPRHSVTEDNCMSANLGFLCHFVRNYQVSLSKARNDQRDQLAAAACSTGRAWASNMVTLVGFDGDLLATGSGHH
jgi:hypothetical protein